MIWKLGMLHYQDGITKTETKMLKLNGRNSAKIFET